MTEFKHNNITLLNCDCMDYMSNIPDKKGNIIMFEFSHFFNSACTLIASFDVL